MIHNDTLETLKLINDVEDYVVFLERCLILLFFWLLKQKVCSHFVHKLKIISPPLKKKIMNLIYT